MSILNNLPTNPYSYPHHDCYWLVKHIRNYYELETPDFTWTHNKYLTASEQPRNLTLTCLRTCAKIRTGKPSHLDLAVFKQSLSSDLGTVIIEGAERFGLAQLHQLRGRVIRSNHQAYCYVFAETKTDKTLQRLKAFKNSSNGFELAELDLSLRGSGELSGTKQWGISDLGMEAIKNIKMV